MHRDSTRIGDDDYIKLRTKLPDVPIGPIAAVISVLRINARQLSIYRDVLDNGMTYRALGSELGISAQRIYEIVQKVATKIRIHGHKIERGEE